MQVPARQMLPQQPAAREELSGQVMRVRARFFGEGQDAGAKGRVGADRQGVACHTAEKATSRGIAN